MNIKVGKTSYYEPGETLSLSRGLQLDMGYGHAFGPYSINQRDKEQFIIDEAFSKRLRLTKTLVTTPLIMEPDLFVRFAELPETAKAYHGFIAQYGFLGINRQPGFNIYWADNEEPVLLINSFHRTFRTAVDIAKLHVEGSEADGIWLSDYLSRHIQAHTKLELRNFSPILRAETLIGALVLQLYHFTDQLKQLHKCKLPECHRLTTKPKFCTDYHNRRFHSLKSQGKIIKINGKWIQKPPEKRGPKPKRKDK